MTNRTVQVCGFGFAPSDVTLIATVDGQTVFNGAIPTSNRSRPTLPDSDLENSVAPVLFTFEIPVNFQGTKSMTYQVTNGTVVLTNVKANYCPSRPNDRYSLEEFQILTNLTSDAPTNQQKYNIYALHASPAFTQEETNTILNYPNSGVSLLEIKSILSARGLAPIIDPSADIFGPVNENSDPRSNVSIDGVPQSLDHSENPNGTWWWTVNSGSTLSCDLNITAGTE